MSHSAEKFRRGKLLRFRKFMVPKNVRDKRGGGYHDFLSKLFCLTVRKNFLGELLCVSQNFWYRKNLRIRGGWGRRKGVKQFSVETFLSHSAEQIRRGIILCCVSENLRQPKSLWIRGGGGSIRSFRRIFLCLTVPKKW